MPDKKFLGWSSLGLFVLAVLILLFIGALLVFFPAGVPIAWLNAQVLIIVSGVLALIAALLGFLSRQTPQGKVGGIGGLVLSIAIAVLLSFTLIARVETTISPVMVETGLNVLWSLV